MKKRSLVSIIIRTKNEERWILQCLEKIFMQNYKNFEVIIVDNFSKDKTLEIAKKYKVKLAKIKTFFPGKAINIGIKKSQGEYIVCLSAHCIPLDQYWLKNLINDLKKKNVAAVYGRQVPLPYSSPFDKRDLLNTFGLEKKIQKKDTFFHNANSAFKKKIWNKLKFDEKTVNIEDRIWAHNVIKLGYHIVYEPKANVYHFHGIHQNLDEKRCLGVVNILEKLDDKFIYKNFENPSKLKINAILLQKGKFTPYKKNLIKNEIFNLKKSKYIKKIVFSSESSDAVKTLKKEVDLSILRSKDLINSNIDILTICRKTLELMERRNIYSDILIITTDNYPRRQKNFYGKLIKKIVKDNLDLVMAKIEEQGTLWKNDNGKIECINNTLAPRKFRKTKYFTTPFSYGFAVRPFNIRKANIDYYNAGFINIKDPNR